MSHPEAPAAADPAPYPLPPTAVRRGIGAGGALTAAAGVPALAATEQLSLAQSHLLICLIALVPLGIYIGRVDRAVHRIPNWAVAALALIHLGAAAGVAAAGSAPGESEVSSSAQAASRATMVRTQARRRRMLRR